MKKIYLLTWIMLVLSACGMDNKYQHDADICRLRHLKYYGDLIEEYHKKTGQYPLQDRWQYPNFVYIANEEQKKHISLLRPSYKHAETDRTLFREIIEKGLGKNIDLKYDPQLEGVAAPNFYVYVIYKDEYYFAVNFYNEYPFTVRMAKNYNRIQITSAKPPYERGVWKLESLLNDKEFNKAMSEKPYKEGWFLEMERKYK